MSESFDTRIARSVDARLASEDARECGRPDSHGPHTWSMAAIDGDVYQCPGALPSSAGPDAETLAAWLRTTANKLGWNQGERDKLNEAADALSGLVALVEQRERERDDQRTRRYELAADATRKCTEFRERAEKAEALVEKRERERDEALAALKDEMQWDMGGVPENEYKRLIREFEQLPVRRVTDGTVVMERGPLDSWRAECGALSNLGESTVEAVPVSTHSGEQGREASGDSPTLARAEKAEALLARHRQALEEMAEPLCDAAFRARLLRQGLSTDEMAQYVEDVEALQAKAAALAASAPGTEET